MSDKANVASSANQLGFDLLHSLRAQGSATAHNTIVSPVSIAAALTMTANGAKEETKEEMARVLHLPTRGFMRASRELGQLLAELLTADPKVTLEIANALFPQTGYAFKKPFLNRNKNDFAAEISEVDYKGNPAEAVSRINSWCADKTHGKIPAIVASASPETRLFLLNAVYFKGTWLKEFDQRFTRDGQFSSADGKQVTARMMTASSYYKYAETADYKIVALPYGEGKRFSMYFYLPALGVPLADAVNTMDVGSFEQIVGSMSGQEGTVCIPQFEIDYDVTLNGVLQALGMTSAFDDECADFSAMVAPPERLSVSLVKHKTYMKLDEQGTEAAAVTAVGMVRTTSVSVGPPPFYFRADRPYMLALRDDQTGALLFLGCVDNPKKQ